MKSLSFLAIPILLAYLLVPLPEREESVAELAELASAFVAACNEDDLVAEVGVARFLDSRDETLHSEASCSAILVKSGNQEWLVATARELSTDTDEADPLAGLHLLEGEWIMQGDQMRMELALYLSPSGRSLKGSALVTSPAEGSMETEIRIGYDAAHRQIRWWTFDELGGFSQGIWQALEGSWLVRTNGVTASGETNSAIQELSFESDDEILWKSFHRFLDGEALSDAEFRLVRLPPTPPLTFEADRDVGAERAAAAKN